jgi:mRNA interferase MazF
MSDDAEEAKKPTKPPWVKPRIIAAPKIRQIYRCDFWQDAHLPEMWKTRPVIVVSYKNTLHGPCLVVPTSTEPDNANNRWACKLSIRIEEPLESWALCNDPSTVAPSRFSQFKGKIPLLPEEDFNQVLDLLMKWLPKPFGIKN